MNIGIEASIAVGNKGGTGWYAHRLIDALQRIAPEHTYFLYYDTPPAEAFKGPNLTVRSWSSQRFLPKHLRYLWWLNVILPEWAAKDQLDVLHCPYFLGPLRRIGTKIVLTVHDAGPLMTPELDTRSSWLKFKTLLPWAVQAANAVITDSASARRDVISCLRISDERVWAVPLAASQEYHPISDEADRELVRKKYSVSCPYVLFVGNLEPRKNLPTLIRAFARVKSGYRFPHKLLIVGKKGWMYDEIFKTAQETELPDDIVFVGYVPQNELPALYGAAEVFVFPSWYEGFGLPVIEAMACGTPVIVSNIPVLKELVGDAGVLVDPNSTENFSQAMGRLLANRDLRQSFAEKGLSRSAQFSWEETAKATLQVYQAVCQR